MDLFRPRKPIFSNRRHAGRLLADKIESTIQSIGEGIIFAIPRGGVPVAVEVALKLQAHLHVATVRKLHIPWNPEAGFGAVTPNGSIVLNQRLVANLQPNLTQAVINQVKQEVLKEIKRRDRIYNRDRVLPDLRDKTVIIVDDGLASGYTMLAAVEYISHYHPLKLIVSSPVSSDYAYRLVKKDVKHLVVLHHSRSRVFAVADYYQDWYDLTDKEVMVLLEEVYRKVS